MIHSFYDFGYILSELVVLVNWCTFSRLFLRFTACHAITSPC